MTQVSLVGTGVLGSSWAIVFARAGLTVRVYDPDHAAAGLVVDQARTFLASDERTKAGTWQGVDAILARIEPVRDLDRALDGADYVQESAPERLDIKTDLFGRMDALANPETILVSSTSGFPASSFSAGLEHRRRCLVVHPLNPPHLIPLVEIVPASWTAPSVVERATALMGAVGQSPIRLRREIDGFVVNRLQGAMLSEAFRLVEDGVVNADEVDRAVSEGLGLRWCFLGPFETIDLNARGGIAEYCRSFGPMYHALAKQRADPRGWTEALVASVEETLRKQTPFDTLKQRASWRDQVLASLRIFRSTLKHTAGKVPA